MTLADLLALAERACAAYLTADATPAGMERVLALGRSRQAASDLDAALDPTTVRLLIAVAQAAERVATWRDTPDGDQLGANMQAVLLTHRAIEALHAHLEKG